MNILTAKKILGDYGKTLSDQEIQKIIDCFNGAIEVGLRQFERKFKIKTIESKLTKPSEKLL